MSTTTGRERQTYETTEYVAMLRRMTRGLGKRLADGDPSDVADALEVAALLDETIRQSVREMRERSGFSWAQIGEATGMTRQAAFQRFSR